VKSGRSRDKSCNTRMLPLRLPFDHPIFSYPDGERSRVAREWLEQGRKMTETMGEMKRELQEIKHNLKIGGQLEPSDQVTEQEDNTNSQKNTIDPTVFLNI